MEKIINKYAYLEAAFVGLVLNVVLTHIQLAFIESPETSKAVSDFISSSPYSYIAAFAVLVAVAIPIGEEIVFRKLTWDFMSKFIPEGLVAFLIAVGFAFIHAPDSAIFLLPFAVYLSYLRYSTGSVKLCMAAHIAFNTTGLLLPMVIGWTNLT